MQTAKRKLVVEIGHGERPVWTTLRKMPLTDQVYLGFDINSDRWPLVTTPTGFFHKLNEGRRKIERRRIEGRACYWMPIDELGNLPIGRGAADELYAMGVLSDPRISPLVIDALVESITNAVRPGGVFVADNLTRQELSDPGDILIDFNAGTAIFRQDRGPVTEVERRSRHSMLLNSAFTPLPASDYLSFFAERGLPESVDPDPGGRFSVLVKK